MSQPSVVVVGSLNVDHTFRVTRLPTPGETVNSHGVSTSFGGKGANQAIAAARAGGAVKLIGAVGKDDAGERYIARLREQAIRVDKLAHTNTPTGSAIILVDDKGENCIVVNGGANHTLTVSDVDQAAEMIEESDVLLMQLECPLVTVGHAARIARAAGVLVMLNPSPWSTSVLPGGIPVDVLIVNEHEAASILGETIAPGTNFDVSALFARAGCRTLVVTRGAKPTWACSIGGQPVEVTPPQIVPVDTVGAGDAFAGALAVALGERQSLPAAVAFANAAGALATLKPGAQTAIPERDAILAILRKTPNS